MIIILCLLLRMHALDVLDAIFDSNPRLVEMRDGEGRNPLHYVASLGYIDEARYLLKRHAPNATRRDEYGLLPIHLASFEGHVDVTSLLLQDFPGPRELLDKNGCNIFHAAAKSGRHNVIRLVLENPGFDCLINMKDKSGNTALHWASCHFHPKIVHMLTWDRRVDIKAVNNNGMSALDVAEYYMSYYNPPFKQVSVPKLRLIQTVLYFLSKLFRIFLKMLTLTKIRVPPLFRTLILVLK